MGIEAKLTFYRILQAGYYEFGGKKPLFCDAEKLLTDLAAWGDGKDISQSKLFDSNPDGESLPVYLFACRKLSHGWLLVLWNETSSEDGKVFSISSKSKVGAVKVQAKTFNPNDIPGYASYYWIDTKTGIMSSIRFFTAGSNHQGMQRYLESFLAHASPHAVVDPKAVSDDVDIAIAGYAMDGASEVCDVEPRFRTAICKEPGDSDYVINHANSVRRIRHRTRVQKANATSVDIWQRALGWAHLKRPAEIPKGVRIQYDLSVSQLAVGEVETIVAAYETLTDKIDTWEDYGFVLKGDPKTYWLSGAYVRKKMLLDVTIEAETSMIELSNLASELNKRRLAMLAFVK